jgi:hypothetical protein
MITSLSTLRDASLSEITKMVENTPNNYILVQRFRLSRLKLGSVLERLEAFEPGPGALERLNDHSESIACEIDSLIETIREIMGR